MSRAVSKLIFMGVLPYWVNSLGFVVIIDDNDVVFVLADVIASIVVVVGDAPVVSVNGDVCIAVVVEVVVEVVVFVVVVVVLGGGGGGDVVVGFEVGALNAVAVDVIIDKVVYFIVISNVVVFVDIFFAVSKQDIGEDWLSVIFFAVSLAT